MKRKLSFISALAVFCLGTGLVVARSASTAGVVQEFDELTLSVEINATDLDAGIVFFVDTDESVELLRIVGPTGETVLRLGANDPVDLGLTEIRWESAEPDIQTPLLAYPEGKYTVTAMAFNGTLIEGVVDLSHSILEAPQVFIRSDELEVDQVVIEWVLDPKAERYWLEVDGGSIGEFTLPMLAGINRFQLPESLLEPATEYKVGVAVVGDNGNAVMSEVEFATLP